MMPMYKSYTNSVFIPSIANTSLIYT